MARADLRPLPRRAVYDLRRPLPRRLHPALQTELKQEVTQTQGRRTENVRLVSRWVLADCGAERLQLRADEQNVASRKVAENAGFTEEGTLRSSRYNARLGRRVDFVMYSLLPGEL